MAKWNRVPEATGYRLDVSTNGNFSRFVEGYRDLDVGNVTGQVVIGLKKGRTYYYRVRAYNRSGTSANSSVMTGHTTSSSGLVINPTF